MDNASMITAHSVDWGNVPQWLSGVLTGASLILGFSIIIRDRRLRLGAQARQIFITTTASMGRSETLTVRIFNESSQRIYGATLYIFPGSKEGSEPPAKIDKLIFKPRYDSDSLLYPHAWDFDDLSRANDAGHGSIGFVEPHGTAQFTYENIEPGSYERLFVQFIDNAGIMWAKELRRSDIRRVRRRR